MREQPIIMKRLFNTLKYLICSLMILGLAACSSANASGSSSSGRSTLAKDKSSELGYGSSSGVTGATSPQDERAEHSTSNDPLWANKESIKAMIISDLHYTEKEKIDHLAVPGIALSKEITDALIDEVIDRKPDVFIMTGDNTNSGSEKDVTGLVGKLQRIKDAGIPMIITTGNHDYDFMDSDGFENAYFGLLDPIDRDVHSLSYTAMVKDVVFLAMDDQDPVLSTQGKFSPETMEWLKEMLEKYHDYKIIFLSHHNVLYGVSDDTETSNVIHNPELRGLLRDSGVKLAMTGHMHSQYILESDGLWEIMSGMPFAGGHLMGNLAIGDDRLVYYAAPIDFAKYGSSIQKKLNELDIESSVYMSETMSSLLESEGLEGLKKKNVQKLLTNFFQYYQEGTLAEHRDELKKNSLYRDMIKAMWNHNYGPWIKSMIENTKHNGRELEIQF